MRLRIELQEYDFVKDSTGNKKFFCENDEIHNATLFYEYSPDGSHYLILKDGENSEKCRFKLKEPLLENIPDEEKESDWSKFARFLGLHVEFENLRPVLKAHWFVGITRLLVENGEIIVQVKPKMDNLNSIGMLMEVLSHPQVSPHIKSGETYEILTNERPIELEEVPDDYLLFLLIHYLKILNDLLKRGLQKGYRRATENLRGRVRGRLLVGKTIRENWSRGKKHYTHCSYQIYTPDTLENRILKAAFLKARGYIHSQKLANGTLGRWIGRANAEMEMVSSVRIYPGDFSLTTVQRIRPDYRIALSLAKIILRTLGYDPTVETAKERIRHIYPYWIDMNELFERYVEVKLRRGEIGVLKDYRVYPGYGYGEGIPIKDKSIGKLRPDFVLVKKEEDENIKIAIGDAKYKEDYKNGWVKEDLQQVALYGRIKWGKIKKWIEGKYGASKEINCENQNEKEDCPGREPEMYIFYPVEKSNEQKLVSAESFRGIHKIGIQIPLK